MINTKENIAIIKELGFTSIELLLDKTIWGINSVGRVSALQAECRKFDSCILHHYFEINTNWCHEPKNEASFLNLSREAYYGQAVVKWSLMNSQYAFGGLGELVETSSLLNCELLIGVQKSESSTLRHWEQIPTVSILAVKMCGWSTLRPN